NLTPTNGRDEIVAQLLSVQPDAQARHFTLAEGHVAPRRVKRTGIAVVEAIFQFETATGRGMGVLRMPLAQPGKVWTFSTSLRELKGYEEPVGPRRPDGS